MEPKCILMAGPTLAGLATDAIAGFPLPLSIQPPVVRGDVRRLVEQLPPRVLIVVDGRFHNALAVGHAELREAVEQGWRVWGLSSIGAIRAYELRGLGMRGFGEVYERFLEEEDFQDDEVALLHESEPPYRSISEPMVHLRAALADLVARGLLLPGAAQTIGEELKSRWYGERTVALLEHLALDQAVQGMRSALQASLHDFDRFRLKSQDLQRFLASPRELLLGTAGVG